MCKKGNSPLENREETVRVASRRSPGNNWEACAVLKDRCKRCVSSCQIHLKIEEECCICRKRKVNCYITEQWSGICKFHISLLCLWSYWVSGELQLFNGVWRCNTKSKGQRSIKLNKTLVDHTGCMGPLWDSSGRIQFTPTQPWHVSLCKCCWEQLKHSSCIISQISCQDLFCSRSERPDHIVPHRRQMESAGGDVPHFHSSNSK